MTGSLSRLLGGSWSKFVSISTLFLWSNWAYTVLAVSVSEKELLYGPVTVIGPLQLNAEKTPIPEFKKHRRLLPSLMCGLLQERSIFVLLASIYGKAF